MLQRKFLSAADLENYQPRIETAIDSVFDDEGRYLHGSFLQRLKVARRGWVLRGIHEEIAETSLDHIASLDRSANAITYNVSSGVNPGVLNRMFSVHDDIDAFDFDITPNDEVSRDLQLKIEKFAMESFYGRYSDEIGYAKLADYASFESRRTHESRIAYWLDKQDAATHAKYLQNNIDLLRIRIESDERFVTHLFEAQGVGTMARAIPSLVESLNAFYDNNWRDIFEEKYQHEIAAAVQNYTGPDVKVFYLNQLSSFDIK